jgi:hypothetical protein
MNAEFFEAIADIEKEKGIPRQYMYDKINQAMLTAFRRDNPECGDNVEVILDEEKKQIDMVVHKTVVETVEDPNPDPDNTGSGKEDKQKGQAGRRSSACRWSPKSSAASPPSPQSRSSSRASARRSAA